MRRLVIALLALIALAVFGAEAWTHYAKGAALSLVMVGVSIAAAGLAGWLADRPDTEAAVSFLLRAGREARTVAPPPFTDDRPADRPADKGGAP